LPKKAGSGATTLRRGASIVVSRRTAFLCASLGVLGFVATPRAAHAYTIQSPVTRGCHEEITIDAWRRIQAELPDATAAIRANRDDEALIADVPFDLPSDLQELGLVTLLLGIRENDIADLAATIDTDQLKQVLVGN
jgi:hypothetical protein